MIYIQNMLFCENVIENEYEKRNFFFFFLNGDKQSLNDEYFTYN